ncbi:hypothetical protein [Paenibacillus sp. DYY-L-2]|uniref:hypothetical protein n=1 Tax=Paenibacillus sp. DYY-L-2 TaxID=3447013 RepID=UPI003F4FE818
MREQSKRKVGFLIVVTILTGFVWIYFSEHTSELAVVQEVDAKDMTITNMSGRTRTIGIPEETSKLIEKDREYFIQYEKKIFGNYKLLNITPTP